MSENTNKENEKRVNPIVEENNKKVANSNESFADLNDLLLKVMETEEEQEDQIDYRNVAIKMNANSAAMQDNGVQLVSLIKDSEGVRQKHSVRLHRADLTEDKIISEILNRDIELINPTRTVLTTDRDGNKLREVNIFYTAEDYKVLDKTKKSKDASFFDMNLSLELEGAELEEAYVPTGKKKNGKDIKEPVYRVIGEKQEGMQIIPFTIELKLDKNVLSILKQKLEGKIFDVKVNYIQKLKGKTAFTTQLPAFK